MNRDLLKECKDLLESSEDIDDPIVWISKARKVLLEVIQQWWME